MTNFEKELIMSYNRWRGIKNITNTCDPKTYGEDMVNKKNKMRGGSKKRK